MQYYTVIDSNKRSMMFRYLRAKHKKHDIATFTIRV